MTNSTDNMDVRILATEFLMYKVGDFINKYYFPVSVPIGVTGNILSFLVMIQPHNRNHSMSVYLAALTFPDTIILCLGFIAYLAMEHDVYIPPGQKWYCRLYPLVIFVSFLSSTLLVIAMTFERFYSIIMPHKAASFNTVKRAKITVACLVAVSIMYNLPHFILTSNVNWECVPYGNVKGNLLGEVYYWLSAVVQFVIPFILLLIMNSVIIHKIRNRFVLLKGLYLKSSNKELNEGGNSPAKNSVLQIVAILLLVTFAFLVLTTPPYIFFFFVLSIDFSASPRLFAGYYLFYNVVHKLHITNHGINFFLYVISGKKFRTDLRNLFPCSNKAKVKREPVVTISENLAAHTEETPNRSYICKGPTTL